MTEEEKLMYEQQNAHAEDDMAKKKEEILTQFLKDKLQKEEKNIALNLLKLNEGWRSILRQTRTAELHSDIAVLSQTFERQLDHLDSVIKHLVSDLEEAEQQATRAHQSHLQQLDCLRAHHETCLRFLQQQWEGCLQHLNNNFSSERQEMFALIQEQWTDLQDRMFSLERLHAKEAENKSIYSQEEENINKLHFNLMSGQTLQHGSKMDELLQNHEAQSSCEEMNNVQRLAAENQHLLQEMEAKMKQVQKLQDSVNELQSKLHFSQTQNETDAQNLNATRDEVVQKNHELRAHILQQQTKARKQLTELSVQGNSASKTLKAVIAKGEKILHLAEMCQKLESEQESFSASVSVSAKHQEERPQPQPLTEELMQEVVTFPELTPLRERLSAALLQQQAVKQHKDHLKGENLQLQDLIRQHLGAMALSAEPLAAGRPPRTVQPALKTGGAADSKSQHTVVEAALVVNHTL